MTLSPQFLDELRARTTLSTLIGRTTKLQKAGREYRACCPFHNEKTPSFYVNDDKGFYHCFGCSAHGDAIRWMTDQRGLPFIDAVKELAQAAGMEMPATDPHAAQQAEAAKGLHEACVDAAAWFSDQLHGLAGAAAREVLAKRGIKPETARAFGLGFAPDTRGGLKTALKAYGDPLLVEAGLLVKVDDKAPYDRFRGRLTIPIRDQRGRTIAFGGRIIGDGEPKYLNSPETPLFDKGRTLYNIDRAAPAARKAGRLIVVEGYMDVIALAGAGIDEVVAPNGTAVTEAQLERMWRLSDVPILCLDGDVAGQKAALRAAHRALPLLSPGKTLRFAMLPDGMDPDDIVRQQDIGALEKILEKTTALDELIWQSELNKASLDTPEGRAALGKSLRDHARMIKDYDVQTLYLAAFKQRHYDLFNIDRLSQRTETTANRWRRAASQVAPELLAIRDFGMAKAVYAPAALSGLRRYPNVVSSHAEDLGKLSLLLLHRGLRQVCREMLDAALTQYPLERDQLERILLAAGLHAELDRMSKRQRVPFSFLLHGTAGEVAERDLAAVMEILVASPEVEAAMAEATESLKSDITEAAFAKQARIVQFRENLLGDLANLLQTQADAEFNKVEQ